MYIIKPDGWDAAVSSLKTGFKKMKLLKGTILAAALMMGNAERKTPGHDAQTCLDVYSELNCEERKAFLHGGV